MKIRDLKLDEVGEPVRAAVSADSVAPERDPTGSAGEGDNDLDPDDLDPEDLDLGLGDPEDEDDDGRASDVLSLVSSESYATDYTFTENSEDSPEKIAKMTPSELADLADDTREKMRATEISKRHGLYEDDDYAFLQKKLSFIDAVIEASESLDAGK